MTRARACAIENEVNSFLFNSHFDSCEDWILPQTETVFMLRYQEDDSEKERTETRATTKQGKEEKKEKKQGPQPLDTPGARPPWPRVPGLLGPGCPASAWEMR